MKINMLKLFVYVILVSLCVNTQAQDKYKHLSGYVFDQITKEPLIGAYIICSENNKGTITDENGYFQLTPDGYPVKIRCSFVGYEAKELVLDRAIDSLIQFYLKPGILINDIVISPSRSHRTDVVNMTMQHIKSIPNITGEPDVLKSLQTMPGIQMGKEGTSDLYVRGGDKDENLYLLDGIPLYYVNHVGGFMSVFDPNIIKSVKLYKGVMPAKYSGRLSSAVDVRLKDGNAEQKQGEFMIGTLATKVYLEGPLNDSGKTKYLLSLRRCNLDLFMRPISYQTSNGDDVNAYTFYDFTAKLTHTYSLKDKLTLMMYSGRDVLKQTTNYNDKVSNKVKWGNLLANVTYKHLFNNGLYNELQLSINRFYNKDQAVTKNDDINMKEKFSSTITDLVLANRIKYMQSKVDFELGVRLIFHHYKPIAMVSNDRQDTWRQDYAVKNKNLELNLYLDTDIRLTPRLNIQPGVTLTNWAQTNTYKLDSKIHTSYSLLNNLHLNAAYSYNHQFVHLLSSFNAGMTNELWLPSDHELPPKSSELYSAGAIFHLSKYSFQVEAFVKHWRNLIMYSPSSLVRDAYNWKESIMGDGKGKMQGIEFLASKNSGKLTGSVAYTLSKNTRQYKEIDENKEFPFKYDRRHEITCNACFNFNKNKRLVLMWVYNSASPTTLPLQHYPAISDVAPNGETVFQEGHYYGNLNNYRIEAYHRLDIAYSRAKKRGKTERIWTIGLYNAYNKMNPFYFYYKKSLDKKAFDPNTGDLVIVKKGGDIKLKKYTMFPMMPIISYAVKF
ncbi:MAG: TonB-dependent receptor [Carboxylicivirga sp.]|nr:TonB-dependent receptor [Carboxylicivirga sp.]